MIKNGGGDSDREKMKYVCIYTLTRGDHRHIQLGKQDPSNQCSLLRKPGQCFFQPAIIYIHLRV